MTSGSRTERSVGPTIGGTGGGSRARQLVTNKSHNGKLTSALQGQKSRDNSFNNRPNYASKLAAKNFNST